MTYLDVPPLRTMKVVASALVSASVRMLQLDGAIEAEPGQFAMVWVPGLGERPYSLAGTDPVVFVVQPVGAVSEALCGLDVGDRVSFRAPLGRGFTLDGAAPILVGGGCGVAPLRELAVAFQNRGREVTTLIGAATADQLVRLPDWPGTVSFATDDGSWGHRGTVVDLLAELLEKGDSVAAPDSIHACGPELMLAAVIELARTRGLPVQVSLERYMKCGVGLCGHCAMDPGGWIVCTEGPVATGEECRCLGELGRYRRSASGCRESLGCES